MKTITLGVVGCGYWGPNLIRNFRNSAGCRLACICDTDSKRLEHLKRVHPEVETLTSFDALLAAPGVDAVAVATPVRFHYAMARASLLAGKHTFIEKPMATSSAECRDLVELAGQKRLTLMVGHTFLYSPAVRKIRDIIDSGEIGEIRYISSRRLNLGLFQKDINVVWDLAPHDVSIITHLMKAAPLTVSCRGQAHVTPGIEDVAVLTMTFPGGGFAMVQSSWLDPRKVREMTIVGTRKMIVYDDIEPLYKIRIYDQRVETPPHYDTFAEFQYAYHYGDVYAPHIKQEEPLKVECQHFIDSILNRTAPLTAGETGLELVNILEATTQSLRQGGAQVSLAAT
jgi:predicted dehydrogenase